ncbi:hypothetical protein CXB51_018990 [Gossypium anomalum]|uniref:Reverse transcriptase Ty1/copia-type domain-containing protein n=1 Tax=Gossypium anomalum TaxID=47600 RepID=A0A8J5YHK9_9ROSI|nr:hypothetical protein CXB51_018990 [Gossypium anomalum]
MSRPSSPFAVQSGASPMTFSLSDGMVDSRFLSTKKISVLLNDTNYLLWHQQFISNADGVLQENVDFVRFEQQDSTFASWLLSSVSPGVLLHLIGLDTSAHIWNAITDFYGSKTTSRLMLKKGELFMRDFLVKIKGYCANPASCGETISEHEHVTAILNGLPLEYESVITIITASPTPYTVQDVTTMLLDVEARQLSSVLEVPASANVVTHQSLTPDVKSDPTPAYRQPPSARGRGRGRASGSRFQCQLCGKQGYLIDRCYYRFDDSYKSVGYRPPQSSQANVCMFGASSPMAPWVSPMPVPAPNTQSSWVYPPSMPAMPWSNPFATPACSPDNAWYLDSGATYHLTHSPTSLAESSPYKGPGKVYVGNGDTFSVLSFGQSSLLTRSRLLFMRSLLLVRDMHMGEVLLKGSEQHGLYKLHLTKSGASNSSALAQGLLATSTVPFNVWHCRLGHPCTNILTKALRKCNIPLGVNKSSFHCIACHLGKEHKQPFQKSTTEYTAPLQLVLVDVWGPAPSKVLRVFPHFQRQAERVIGHKLKTLQIDGGGEFQALKRQIVETGLSMLAHASMPLVYWSDAFASAVYLLNRLPSHPINHASPRYSPSHKGYRCLDSFEKVYVTRHVTFNEKVFPFQSKHLKPPSSLLQPQSNSKLLVLSPTPCDQMSNHSPTISVPSYNSRPLSPVSSPHIPPQYTNPSISSSSPSVSPQVNSIPDPLSSLPIFSNTHPMVTRSKVGVFKPKAYVTIAPSSLSDVPTDIHVAMSHDSWKAAVYSELQALINNNTWRLCSLPANRRAVGCKWLFKVKTRADGTVERYKARLVAKGFSQNTGLDYQDTFSPVVRVTTICTVLVIPVMKNWSLRQVDVNNAILNGELAEDIYMEQPPGFEESGPNGEKLVCKLNKALYGLRQAPRAWFQTLRQYLIDQLGFRTAKTDPSLFIRAASDSILLLIVYVDDIVLTGSSNAKIDRVVQLLHTKFALKDMGPLNFFLGITVERSFKGLVLSQQKYVREILAQTGMSASAPTPTPMVSFPKLVADDASPFLADGSLYRSIVGKLQYLCITRPDLAYCVNKLSQFMNAPREVHWKAVKRALHYLSGTINHGLFYSKGQFQLTCYSNADWASSIEDRRSTTGYVVYLGSNPIAWCSKKQAVVSRSTSEAEYRSLANCVSKLLWIKQLLGEVGVITCQTPVIWCDNTSTVSMAANPTHHAKVNYIPSDKQIADAFTKPITPKTFGSVRQALRVLSNDTASGLKEQEKKLGEC